MDTGYLLVRQGWGFQGLNALQYSSRFGNIQDVKKILSRYRSRIDINEQNHYGETALHIAVDYGQSEVVKLLLQAGIDKNLKNKEGKTAKELAEDVNDLELLAVFSSFKSKMNNLTR